MNYRHAYHAGNPSDVFKHVIYAWVLAYMKQKEAPFRVIDTHSGLGLYDLAGKEAIKTGEWEVGIARMRKVKKTPALQALVAPFMEVELKKRPYYPGSPMIACEMMRPQDRGIFIEKHTEDAVILTKNLMWAQKAKVINRDGYEALNALLPAPEKRAVILIDPPFEEEDEEARLLNALQVITTKMPNAVALLWYPIKEQGRVNYLLKNAHALKIPKLINLTCQFEPVDNLSLTGNGLIVLNPPFGLVEAIKKASHEFLTALKCPQGSIRVESL